MRQCAQYRLVAPKKNDALISGRVQRQNIHRYRAIDKITFLN